MIPLSPFNTRAKKNNKACVWHKKRGDDRKKVIDRWQEGKICHAGISMGGFFKR